MRVNVAVCTAWLVAVSLAHSPLLTAQETESILADESGFSLAPTEAAKLDVDTQAQDIATPDIQEPTKKLLRGHYADGKVKLEREEILNEDGDFVNHGIWRTYDRTGNPLVQGHYQNGLPHGDWTRFIPATQQKSIDKSFARFQFPIVSYVKFNQGRMDGEWTITDAKERQIAFVQFKDGRREGLTLLWHTTGKKRYEATYRDGKLDGTEIYFDQKERVQKQNQYLAGRRVFKRESRYKNKKLKTQENYLSAERVVDHSDNWWITRLATYKLSGSELRHGLLRAFHSNGVLQSEGMFNHGRAVDKHTWWYADGQVQVEGYFEDGKRHGQWIWRHKNGLPQARGQFVHGERQGKWMTWDESGKQKVADTTASREAADETTQ